MVLWGLFWEWQSQPKLKSWGWCLHLLWTSDTPCDKNKCKTEIKGKTMAFCNFYKSYCFLAMIRFNKMYPLQESLWKTWGDLNIWPGQEKRPTTSCWSTPNIKSTNTTCYQKKGCDSMEGLCNLLRRLAYPCTYCDIVLRSGLPVSAWFSNTQLTFSNDTHGHSFTPWHPTVVRPFDLQAYSYKGGQLYKTILVS